MLRKEIMVGTIEVQKAQIQFLCNIQNLSNKYDKIS